MNIIYVRDQFCSLQFLMMAVLVWRSTITASPGIVRGGVAFLDQGNFLLSNAKWTVVFDVPTVQFVRQIGRIRVALRHLNVGIEKVNHTDYCKEKALQDFCMTGSVQKE